MAWLSRNAKTLFYGIEYEHPKDDYYDFVFVHDYIFNTESYEGISILEDIIHNMYEAGCKDILWSDFVERLNGEGEMEYSMCFSCTDKTYSKIEYTIDAWTDGWGYYFEKLE